MKKKVVLIMAFILSILASCKKEETIKPVVPSTQGAGETFNFDKNPLDLGQKGSLIANHLDENASYKFTGPGVDTIIQGRSGFSYQIWYPIVSSDTLNPFNLIKINGTDNNVLRQIHPNILPSSDERNTQVLGTWKTTRHRWFLKDINGNDSIIDRELSDLEKGVEVTYTSDHKGSGKFNGVDMHLSGYWWFDGNYFKGSNPTVNREMGADSIVGTISNTWVRMRYNSIVNGRPAWDEITWTKQ